MHVRGDFGEVAVGGHADAAAKGLADVGLDGLLDGEGDFAGVGGLLLAAEELADHLVDGGGVGDGADVFDGCGDFVGVLGVGGVGAVDEDDVGDEGAGFADFGEGFDAAGFALIAGGDDGAGVGHGAYDGCGFPSEFGVDLLFDGGEEAVEIDVEKAETVFGCGWAVMEGVGHRSLKQIIFVFCSLLREG